MLRFTAAAALLLTFSTTTLADLIIEARETGGDVVFTTSGSLDLTGWTKSIGSSDSFITPNGGFIAFGTPVSADLYYLGSDLSPTNFGTGGYEESTSASGDPFSFLAAGDVSFGATVWVETNYVFGQSIDATMTFENATFDTLGIDSGDTVWSWSIEPVAFGVSPVNGAPITGSITLRAIPEPSAFAFLGLIGLVAGGRSWWKRRR